MTALEAVATALFGALAGILSGLLGVGGGIVMVPYLGLALGLDQHVAEGTSLLVIVPTAMAGVLAHARRGRVDWRTGRLLGILGVFGAIAGAQVALVVPPTVLRRVFAGFLVLIGIRFLRRSLSPSKDVGAPAGE